MRRGRSLFAHHQSEAVGIQIGWITLPIDMRCFCLSTGFASQRFISRNWSVNPGESIDRPTEWGPEIGP